MNAHQMEGFCSFMFCLVVLNVRHRATTFTGSKAINHLIEAIAMMWILLISQKLTFWSTASPAIALALAVTTASQSSFRQFYLYEYANTWVFVTGPLFGGLLAGWFWNYFHYWNCKAITCPGAQEIIIEER